jgi:hypothetical protein
MDRIHVDERGTTMQELKELQVVWVSAAVLCKSAYTS